MLILGFFHVHTEPHFMFDDIEEFSRILSNSILLNKYIQVMV